MKNENKLTKNPIIELFENSNLKQSPGNSDKPTDTPITNIITEDAVKLKITQQINKNTILIKSNIFKLLSNSVDPNIITLKNPNTNTNPNTKSKYKHTNFFN